MKNKYVKHAHISEVMLRKVLKLFCADLPALTTGGLSGLRVQGTQSLYDGLRLRIMELALAEARPFAGEVEIDESSFGARRVRGKRGRGAGGKTPVIGLLKRGGKGWKSYDGLVLGGDKHHRIHHHQNQFARGKNHVNGIESFWSFTKLRLAKLRGIRPQYFFLHLKGSEWRWNHRHDNLNLLTQKPPLKTPLKLLRPFIFTDVDLTKEFHRAFKTAKIGKRKVRPKRLK